MSIYGYRRISTPKQSIERQLRNILAAYPTAVIYKEAYTGTKMDRPEWQKLLSKIRTGDTVVFDSVSRMSRDAQEGFALYEELYNKGINLVFLKEHHIDTQVYKDALNKKITLTGDKVDFILEGINKYLMALAEEQIKIAFDQAQKEVDDLKQRTIEGLQTAKLKGHQVGRKAGSTVISKKSVECKEKILKLSKSFNGSLNDTDLIKFLGITKNTFYKYKKELME